MHPPVVAFHSVSRKFGDLLALDDLSFEVRRGWVYGLVGANGAGKTTLIKHILGRLRAQQGQVRVFGLDPVREPVAVLGRIGYLSEHRDLPEWMRIGELMWYLQAHYPGWQPDYCRELLVTFGLDPRQKVRDLSRGMRAQAALIAAVSHQPELLLLDEPSTGLDAVVRQDILNAVIRAVADDGRTAIFSSHLLDEVERMSDYVMMMDSGRLVLQGTVDEIRNRHHCLHVSGQHEASSLLAIEGILSADGQGRQWQLVAAGDETALRQRLQSNSAEVINVRPATLQEVFVARAGRRSAPIALENQPCPA